MTLATKGPWRRGVWPNERPNQIYGIDRVDGTPQLIAELRGYSDEEIAANISKILSFCNQMYEA